MHLLFAQIQLGLLGSFLHVFAGLALALAWLAVIYERFRITRDSDSFRFWLRVFALSAYAALILGGLTMVQTGLVLPQAPARVGNVLGPLLLSIALVTYVVKSTTFGVVLYSRHRVTPWLYRMSLFVTALGITAVVFGLAVMDSWLRAPAGASFLDGQFRIHDWFEVIDNPQAPLQVMFTGLTAVLMLSSVQVGAWSLQARNIATIEIGHGRLTRLLAWIGLACSILALPLLQMGLDEIYQPVLGIQGLLQGWDPQGSDLGQAATFCARVFLVVWVMHVLVMLIAISRMHMNAANPEQVPGWVLRVMSASAMTGPLVCLLIWWLFFLGKDSDFVAGVLPVADLVTHVSTNYLFVGVLSSVLVTGLVFLGWYRLAYQALAVGVTTVHRPGVMLS